MSTPTTAGNVWRKKIEKLLHCLFKRSYLVYKRILKCEIDHSEESAVHCQHSLLSLRMLLYTISIVQNGQLSAFWFVWALGSFWSGRKNYLIKFCTKSCAKLCKRYTDEGNCEKWLSGKSLIQSSKLISWLLSEPGNATKRVRNKDNKDCTNLLHFCEKYQI